MRPRLAIQLAALVIVTALVACSDDGATTAPPPATGTLVITTTSTGDTLDNDGYTVSVNGEGATAIGLNGSVTIDADTGQREVLLEDIQKNCSVVGDNPRGVTVRGGETTTVDIEVMCRAAIFDRILFSSDRNGHFDIYAMRPDGSDIVQLTDSPGNEFSPTVSPDGTRIAFHAGFDIVTMNVDGTDRTSLDATVSGIAVNPDWGPNGDKIAFHGRHQSEERLHIFVVDADGTMLEQLTDEPVNDTRPAWSPDGTKIAFGRRLPDLGGPGNVFVMSSAGSEITQLTDRELNDRSPDWSPDGARITLQSSTITGPGVNPNIAVMDADGANWDVIVDDPRADRDPVWSPDGEWIAFVSTRDGDEEIYLVRPDGTGIRRVTNDPARDFYPTWAVTR